MEKIISNAQFSAFAAAHPKGWALGMRGELRICPVSSFIMNVDKFDHREHGKGGTVHSCYVVADESGLPELASLIVSQGRGRPYSAGFRYPQVITALAGVGYILDAPTTALTPMGRRSRTRVAVSPVDQLATLRQQIAAVEQQAKADATAQIAAAKAALALALQSAKVAGVHTERKDRVRAKRIVRKPVSVPAIVKSEVA